MKKWYIFLTVIIVFLIHNTMTFSQKPYQYVPKQGTPAEVIIEGGDTIYHFNLEDIEANNIGPFKNADQEKFFWKTVRDVKVTLPYAKMIVQELNKTNGKLATLKDDKNRKKYLEQYEKEVFKKYEANLRRLTINQGKILFKLIDRESEQTPYELIKIYRGSFTAFFWQGVASIFGSNLKSEYDPQGKDKNLEKIIKLVEAGRL